MRMPARRATKPRVGSLGEERNAAGAAFGGNPKGRGIIWAQRGVARRLFGITKRHSSRLALHPKLPPSRSCAECQQTPARQYIDFEANLPCSCRSELVPRRKSRWGTREY